MQEGAQMAGDFSQLPFPHDDDGKVPVPFIADGFQRLNQEFVVFRCAERDPTVMNTGSRFRGAGGISPKKCGLTIMPLGKEPSVSSRPWRSSSSSPNRGMSV